MAFLLKDVPEEVKHVWEIQAAYELSKSPVGTGIWNKLKSVIDRYPEWFPDDPNEELPVSESRLKELSELKNQ